MSPGHTTGNSTATTLPSSPSISAGPSARQTEGTRATYRSRSRHPSPGAPLTRAVGSSGRALSASSDAARWAELPKYDARDASSTGCPPAALLYSAYTLVTAVGQAVCVVASGAGGLGAGAPASTSKNAPSDTASPGTSALAVGGSPHQLSAASVLVSVSNGAKPERILHHHARSPRAPSTSWSHRIFHDRSHRRRSTTPSAGSSRRLYAR